MLSVSRQSGPDLTQALRPERLGSLSVLRVGERPGKKLLRLSVSRLLTQQPSQVVHETRIPGTDSQRFSEALFCEAVVVQAHVNQAAQVVGFTVSRIRRNGLFELIQGDCRLPLLKIPDRQLKPNTSALACLRLVRIGDHLGPAVSAPH